MLKKKKWPSEGDKKKLSPVFYSSAPKCVVSDAWPAPATYHRPFCEHCEGGSEPRTSAPRSDFMAQSLAFCRSMSRTRKFAASNERLVEFFSGRSWPNICPRVIFSELFAGLDSTRGSGQEGLKMLRVGWGRVGSGRVGSGGVRNVTGRVGSTSFQFSRIGSGRVKRFSNITGRVIVFSLASIYFRNFMYRFLFFNQSS